MHDDERASGYPPTGERDEQASIERLKRQADSLPGWMAVHDEQGLQLLYRAGAGGSY